jgi:hypothetical protein
MSIRTSASNANFLKILWCDLPKVGCIRESCYVGSIGEFWVIHRGSEAFQALKTDVSWNYAQLKG